MLRFLKIVSVVLFLSVVALAQPEEGTVRGTVIDSEGAVISKARILVHWDPAGSQVGLKTNVGIKEDREVTTDTNGEFEVCLPWGFYDMFVSAPAFSPYCQKIRVKGDSKSRIKLNVDHLVSVELD
jgi:hypothetical protein